MRALPKHDATARNAHVHEIPVVTSDGVVLNFTPANQAEPDAISTVMPIPNH
jgi:hypothetical protein